MANDISTYKEQILSCIKERTGEDTSSWLFFQVEAAARNMAILQAIYTELMEADKLLIVADGSKGQTKKEAHPLLAYFDKLQRTITLQLEALGLNFRTTPSKVTEDTIKAKDKQDALIQCLESIRGGMNAPNNFIEPS